jgi:hypothetical protein
MVPFSPAARQALVEKQLIPFKLAVVPEAWAVQVTPPSNVSHTEPW